MFYPRKIYPELLEHVEKKPITVITGIRRTGKTTLLKQLLAQIKSSNKSFIDLERLDNRDLFEQKNYDNLMKSLSSQGLNVNKKMYLAIDEIQLSRGIASVLKYLYDHYDIKFIVTGSSSYYLKNLFSESLSGRKKIFELFPLDFGECLTFQGVTHNTDADFSREKFNPTEYERLKFYYEQYIEFGGFPEVVLAASVKDKKNLIADIVSSYISVDIKSLADFRNEKSLYALAKMLAGRTGTRLDYSKISRLLGISRTTVSNYIDFFEKTYLISRISIASKSPDRELVKAKKIYFCDNGIVNFLADLDSGAKFENAVFNQLRHKSDLRYYSLKNGREIDFVLDYKLALEVKESPLESDLKDLGNLAKKAQFEEFSLIGRFKVPNFSNYIWGGDIK